MLAGLLAFLPLASTPFQPLPSVQTQAPSFAKTVLADFALWDRDRDGALTLAEVDRAALSPNYRGAEAAALAALHIWLAAAKGATPPVVVPPLTRAWFEVYRPVRLRLASGLSATEAKRARRAYAATPESLGSSFTGAFRRLGKARADGLYGGEAPRLSDIRQGSLGDCFFLAPLGALVHRDAGAVRAMIAPELSGGVAGYSVGFGDGKRVSIAAMTDTELAMGGSAVEEGLWVRVLEKAFGSRDFARASVPAEAAGTSSSNETEPGRIARDGMNGGKTSAAARALTGHAFTSIALVGDFRRDLPAADLTARLTRLRGEIPRALAERRLVLASSPDREMPKSLNPKHAYAIFGYDAATDRITLWNPHGNDFHPTGAEGVENGYAREDGVFTIPLELFARAFSRVYFEKAS